MKKISSALKKLSTKKTASAIAKPCFPLLLHQPKPPVKVLEARRNAK